MGDTNAALLQAILKRNAAASASQPQNPWDIPQGPALSSPPPPGSSPAPPSVIGAAMSPEDLAAQLDARNQALAPMGTEQGMVGGQGAGISAQDATMLQKLMRMFGR